MSHGLVLGGGGPVGIAWEIGVAAGLADAGVQIAGADLIVGTSAGSVVGALLTSGGDALQVFDTHHARPDYMVPVEAAPTPSPDLQPLMAFFLRRPSTGYPEAPLLAEIGAFALRSVAAGETLFVERIGDLVPPHLAWPVNFQCTAVEATDGTFAVWDAASEVDLVRAVASSCAVPGVYPAVTLNGRPYVDGGIRSTTNCDLVAGHDDILVVAVTMPGAAEIMAGMARREMEPLAAAGSRTALIVPDKASLAAFGPSLMDDARRADVLAAGRAQGRVEAERLRDTWGRVAPPTPHR